MGYAETRLVMVLQLRLTRAPHGGSSGSRQVHPTVQAAAVLLGARSAHLEQERRLCAAIDRQRRGGARAQPRVRRAEGAQEHQVVPVEQRGVVRTVGGCEADRVAEDVADSAPRVRDARRRLAPLVGRTHSRASTIRERRERDCLL